MAIDMAKAYNEKMILLNVQPSYETPHTKRFFSRAQIQDFQNQMADEAMQPGLDILKQSCVEFLPKLRVGDPREQICKEARSNSSEEGAACGTVGVRFIVMGSRGLSAVLGTVLGSVSTGVLQAPPAR